VSELAILLLRHMFSYLVAQKKKKKTTWKKAFRAKRPRLFPFYRVFIQKVFICVKKFLKVLRKSFFVKKLYVMEIIYL